jgi:hypothetical protein
VPVGLRRIPGLLVHVVFTFRASLRVISQHSLSPRASFSLASVMDREPLVAPPPARKHVNRMIPNFNADEPDCMTLVLMGEHIDPKELAELSDQGYVQPLLHRKPRARVCPQHRAATTGCWTGMDGFDGC